MEFKKYGTIQYIEQMPAVPSKRMPVLIFLHGAGGRRGTLEKLSQESGLYQPGCVLNREDSPLLVVQPLCHANTWFEIFESLQAFVNMVANRPDVDPRRVYLMGASMGGYTAWQLAMTLPDLFAAVVPVCGGGMYWDAWQLRTTPVWAVHGLLDQVVKPEESIKMVAAINSHPDCPRAKLTLLETADHNAWTYTFQSLEIRDWMLEQVKCQEKIDPKNLFSGMEQFG